MAQFTIRIPDEMRDRIKAAADEDRRSMNSEIEWLLEASLYRRGKGGQGAGHSFVRPGQVAPDLPAPDACVRCGQPGAVHLPATAARSEGSPQ